ncbi:hypothetical protein EH223_13895 [candidate division KSB1 bacterium]|nr:MAG: hypothetical protein EH223_13895 [candidate division KSB1 bacterium]
MNLKQIPKKPLFIFLGFIGLILIILAALPIKLIQHTTNDPSYCNDCHPEFVQMWQQSEMHPDSITCKACHVQGWNPAPVSFEAEPAMTLPNCERCHEEQKTRTEVVRKLIKISHKIHLEDLKQRNLELNCQDCHWTVAHDNGQPPTNRPTMVNCYSASCHPIENETCKLCHFTERFFAAEQNQM